MLIACSIITFIIGLCIGSWISERDSYNHFKKLAKQGFFKDIALNECCIELADKLEIQADGGDDPSEFVKWAVMECWKEADNSSNN